MRPTFDPSSFHESIAADFARSYELVADLEHWQMIAAFAEPDPSSNEEEIDTAFRIASEEHRKEAAELELAHLIQQIHERIAIAVEYCELPDALSRLNRRFNAREGKHSELSYAPYSDTLYSPMLNELEMAYNAFAASIGKGASISLERDRQLLRQVLLGTPKLITDRGVLPSNEAQVRKEIYGMLLHIFPDTVREMPIPKVAKTYKPDIGIRHIQTAIEYKFADSAEELKTSLDGIYADTIGYEGTKDWTRFIAVIYCTDVFMTEPQLREELASAKMPESWEVFLVTGRGARKPTGSAKGTKGPKGTKGAVDVP